MTVSLLWKLLWWLLVVYNIHLKIIFYWNTLAAEAGPVNLAGPWPLRLFLLLLSLPCWPGLCSWVSLRSRAPHPVGFLSVLLLLLLPFLMTSKPFVIFGAVGGLGRWVGPCWCWLLSLPSPSCCRILPVPRGHGFAVPPAEEAFGSWRDRRDRPGQSFSRGCSSPPPARTRRGPFFRRPSTVPVSSLDGSGRETLL